MARNGNGTYSVPNSFVAGTTITASDHNENWTDLASEMTNSLALDGQSTMTGAFKASTGTVLLPGIAFGVDLDSGLYRIGANNIGLALGGAKYFDFATTGLTVTGDVNATIVKQGTYRLVPAGVIIAYAGTVAPDGWLFCNGQAVSRTTYAELFNNVIGVGYGSGDGSTTFNLPDLRGRVIAGKDDMGGSAASRLTATYFGTSAAVLGAAGGAESHTLLAANLPAYTPSGSVSSALSGATAGQFATTLQGFGAANPATVLITGSGSSLTVTGTVTSSFTGSAQGGSSTPVATVQPTFILNYIIKT